MSARRAVSAPSSAGSGALRAYAMLRPKGSGSISRPARSTLNWTSGGSERGEGPARRVMVDLCACPPTPRGPDAVKPVGLQRIGKGQDTGSRQ
jgi:hypothetical protein